MDYIHIWKDIHHFGRCLNVHLYNLCCKMFDLESVMSPYRQNSLFFSFFTPAEKCQETFSIVRPLYCANSAYKTVQYAVPDPLKQSEQGLKQTTDRAGLLASLNN